MSGAADLLERLRGAKHVGPELRADLDAFFEAAAQAEAGRAQAAAKTSRARSARIRAGIRLAAGAVPPAHHSAAVTVQQRIARGKPEQPGPQAFGLDHVPSLPTIRAVLAEMAAERHAKKDENSEPKRSPDAIQPRDTVSQATT
jgi:hypothetical protein